MVYLAVPVVHPPPRRPWNPPDAPGVPFPYLDLVFSGHMPDILIRDRVVALPDPAAAVHLFHLYPGGQKVFEFAHV
uniref:Terminase n=1 Tax=uncultured marine virus TaxID=186617 RepID=A0A0F7L468_9VIRU|nr:terminase [uncultured marine virus]